MTWRGMNCSDASRPWVGAQRRLVGWSVILVACAIAGIALHGVYSGGMWWWFSRPFRTAVSAGTAFGLAACCVAGTLGPRGPVHRFGMYLGVASAMLGAVLGAVATWKVLSLLLTSGPQIEDTLELVGRILFLASAAIAFDGLAYLLRIRGAAAWYRTIAVFAGYGAAGCAAVTLINSSATSYYVGRWGGSLLIIACTGAAIAVIAWWMAPTVRVAFAAPTSRESSVPLACPGCGSISRVVLGRRIPCPSCGLGVTLRLDPPRCTCGYDLSDLTNDACPECGAPVETRNRWALASPHG